MSLRYKFLRHFDLAGIAELEAFARHPARTVDDVCRWLQTRRVPVPATTVYRWITEFREREAEQFIAQQSEAAKLVAVQHLTERARHFGEARMLREQDEVTPEVHQQVVASFRAVLQSLGKSDTWAAKSIGIAPSTLSQVLSDTYKGSTDEYIRRIDKWCDTQAAKVRAPKPTEFVKTTTAMAIAGAAKIANEEESIAIVYGPSGCGKTLTAKYLHSEYPGSLYIDITEGNRRPTAVLEAIARELRPLSIKMTISQLERYVVDQLKGTGRMLLVDEVHTLVTGRSREEQSLNMLRRIQDQTGCPMIWFGTADLARYLEEGVGVRQGVDQIFGRVCVWLDLATPVLLNEPGPGLHTIEDIRKLIDARGMRVTSDAATFLRDISNTPGLGGLRAVDMLLRMVTRRKPGIEITAELLRDFQHARLGRAAAVRAEKRVETHHRKARAG